MNRQIAPNYYNSSQSSTSINFIKFTSITSYNSIDTCTACANALNILVSMHAAYNSTTVYPTNINYQNNQNFSTMMCGISPVATVHCIGVSIKT